jgi:hypothetical protein
MNLGKLLGAGKSFFGGGRVVRYRAGKSAGLPKFNVGKNPFVSKPAEVAAPAPAPAAVAEKISSPVAAPRPVRSANWAEKFNPFRAPEPAVPMPTVQPELLSLDAVKVLHNDLSDAEVEVVPARSRTVTPVAPANYLSEQVLRTV